MKTNEILLKLRKEHNLTQAEMADKLFVTRQAVSRWECGETTPNTETLKLISKNFNVSINTLLSAPENLICQCCGMPLYEDGVISREQDGSFNEDYCKWCYSNGEFPYKSFDDIVEFCTKHAISSNPGIKPEKAYEETKKYLSSLKHWKND